MIFDLLKENKITFEENVDRSSHQSKVSALIEKADDFIEIAEHEKKFF